jgi:hypothetical protein
MYPLKLHWPAQPTPLSADAMPPSVRPAPRRWRSIAGGLTTPTLVALMLVALSSCTSTTAYGSARDSGSPTASAPQSPTAGQPFVATATSRVTRTVTTSATLPVATVTSALVTPSIVQVARTATLSGTSTGPVAVSCPMGDIALSGGWSVPTGNRVYKAILSGNSWSVSVTHQDPTVVFSVTAYVECLSGASGAIVTRRAVNDTLSAGTFNNMAAYCIVGEVPVGFGMDFSASGMDLELQNTQPATFEAGVWWDFYVTNHDSVARTITLYVNCLSNVSVTPSFLGNQGSAVFGHQTGTVAVSCPSGAAVAGGGLSYKGTLTGNMYGMQASSTGWQGSVYAVTSSGLSTIQPTAWVVCLTFM